MVLLQFQEKELVYEQEKLKLQEQYETQLTHIKRWVRLVTAMASHDISRRGNIKEDVELIRVQRELRDKGNKLTSLQSQFLVAEKVSVNSHLHRELPFYCVVCRTCPR